MNYDVVFSIAGLLLSVVVWVVSASFPEFAVSAAGPASYPRAVAVIFAVICLAMIVQALRGHKTRHEPLSRTEYLRLLGVVVILVAYYFAMKYLGYFSSTFIAGVVLSLFVFGQVTKKNLLWSAVSAALSCAGVFLIFQVLLKASLPRGLLF